MKHLQQYIRNIIKESFSASKIQYNENRGIYAQAVAQRDSSYSPAHKASVAAWGLLLYQTYPHLPETSSIPVGEAYDILLDVFGEFANEIKSAGGTISSPDDDYYWMVEEGIGKDVLNKWYRSLSKKTPISKALLIHRKGVERPGQVASYSASEVPYGYGESEIERWYLLPPGTPIIPAHGLADNDEVIGIFSKQELDKWLWEPGKTIEPKPKEDPLKDILDKWGSLRMDRFEEFLWLGYDTNESMFNSIAAKHTGQDWDMESLGDAYDNMSQAQQHNFEQTIIDLIRSES